MLWESSDIFEIMSLARFTNMDLCVLDLTDWLVGFSSGEQMGDEDDDYMLIWWWESDYGFKAEKQTLQRKLKACLDSEIKYHIRTMLYIQWEEQRYSLKMFEARYYAG